MNSFVKVTFLLLPLSIIPLITIYSTSNYHHANNAEENAIEYQIPRHQRAIRSIRNYCKLNQYFDSQEGRCLGVPGGGKALYINNEQSCGTNVLKPHRTSLLYYFICKKDKSILAQCTNGRIFNNRLHRCVRYYPITSSHIIIQPDEYLDNHDHIEVPPCWTLGRFSVPGRCYAFYVCDTNGHRFFQSVFKCPRNTGYNEELKLCTVMPECENDDSVECTICVPQAPHEVVEYPAATDMIEDINPDMSKESGIANDPDTSQSDPDPDPIASEFSSSTDQTRDMTRSSETDETVEMSTLDGTSSFAENAPTADVGTPDEEEDKLISSLNSSPTSTELDDTSHSLTTSIASAEQKYANEANSNIDSATTDTAPFSSVSYTSSELYETTQDMTSELYRNIETVDPDPATSIPEIASIDDTFTELTEETPYTETIDPTSSIPETASIDDTSTELTEETSYTETVDPTSDIPETASIDDMSTRLNEETSYTETIDPTSSIPETTLIDDTSTELNEETSYTETVDPTSDILETAPIDDTFTELTEETPYTETIDPTSSIPETTLIDDTSTRLNEETPYTETIDPTSDILETASIDDTSTELTEETPYTETIDPTSSITETASIGDTSTELNEKISYTDTVDPTSDIPETTSIDDTSTELTEETPYTETIDPTSSITKTGLIDDTSTRLNEETPYTETIDPTSSITETASIDDTSTELNEETVYTETDNPASSISETASIDDTSTKLNEGTSYTETVGPTSDIPETALIDDTPTKLNEDISEMINPPNIPETIPIADVPIELNGEIKDEIIDVYGSDDANIAFPNSARIIDPVPIISSIVESPWINPLSALIKVRKRDLSARQYENTDDITTVLPNTKTDPYATSDILASTSDLNNDDTEFSFEPTSDATMSSDVTSDVSQSTTIEGSAETSSLDNSDIANDPTFTTASTLISEKTESMISTYNTTDSLVISDSTQNDENDTDVSSRASTTE